MKGGKNEEKMTRKKNKLNKISNEREDISKDINELKKRKKELIEEATKKLKRQKGLKKFAIKVSLTSKIGSINNAIKQREQYLSNRFKVKNIRQKVEIEKAKTELQELRKKKAIKVDDILGTQDIFKI